MAAEKPRHGKEITLDDAIDVLKRCRPATPSPEHFDTIGIKLAKRICEVEAGKEPCSAEPFIGLASAFADYGQFEEAIEALEEGIKRDPDDEECQLVLAEYQKMVQGIKS